MQLSTDLCVGVGERIAAHTGKKVLLLNAKPDRETATMSASQYVQALCNGLNRAHTAFSLQHSAKQYVTDVVAVEGSLVTTDRDVLSQLGVSFHTIAGEFDANLKCNVFSKAALASLMISFAKDEQTKHADKADVQSK